MSRIIQLMQDSKFETLAWCSANGHSIDDDYWCEYDAVEVRFGRQSIHYPYNVYPPYQISKQHTLSDANILDLWTYYDPQEARDAFLDRIHNALQEMDREHREYVQNERSRGLPV